MESLDKEIVKEKTFHLEGFPGIYNKLIEYLELDFIKLPDQKNGFDYYFNSGRAVVLVNPKFKTIELYNVDEEKIISIERLIRIAKTEDD